MAIGGGAPSGHDADMPPAASPVSAADTARRVVLLPVGDRPGDLVRRYRLARLRLEPRDAKGADPRFAHLRRTYD